MFPLPHCDRSGFADSLIDSPLLADDLLSGGREDEEVRRPDNDDDHPFVSIRSAALIGSCPTRCFDVKLVAADINWW